MMITTLENQRFKWEESYRQRDNFLFYPNEEIIRFVSKYIRKRVGLTELIDIYNTSRPARLLDLGCGIGRHVVFAHEMGLEAYGIDLAAEALEVARQWARQKGLPRPEERIRQGDIRQLPWADKFFDFVISHGVLDSMHFPIAQQAVAEVHRCLVDGGFFYCDLISGDDSCHSREFAGEEIVQTAHEHGTIQSFFNYEKIQSLFGNYFQISECLLLKRSDVHRVYYKSRYHLTLRKG
jgi:SAM-dependent methyltransferase